MAYGSYTVMPITLKISHIWFLGTLAEMLVGGLLAGVLLGTCCGGSCWCKKEKAKEGE